MGGECTHIAPSPNVGSPTLALCKCRGVLEVVQPPLQWGKVGSFVWWFKGYQAPIQWQPQNRCRSLVPYHTSKTQIPCLTPQLRWVKHWAVEFGRKSPRMAVTGRFGNWVGRLSFNLPQRKKGEKKISVEGIDPQMGGRSVQQEKQEGGGSIIAAWTGDCLSGQLESHRHNDPKHSRDIF